MKVDARHLRIHSVIVVNGECIACRHGNWEYRFVVIFIVETFDGNTQLYAVAVHKVVGWDVQIILGLVIDATGKEVCSVFVYLISLLVGILRILGVL